MTDSELQSSLKYWLKRLKVNSNWQVTAEFVPSEDIEGNRGLNAIMPEDQTSEIFILEGDSEDTLVHEILHILFDGDTAVEDGVYSVAHERALNCVAEALVKLRYEKKTAGLSGAKSKSAKRSRSN